MSISTYVKHPKMADICRDHVAYVKTTDIYGVAATSGLNAAYRYMAGVGEKLLSVALNPFNFRFAMFKEIFEDIAHAFKAASILFAGNPEISTIGPNFSNYYDMIFKEGKFAETTLDTTAIGFEMFTEAMKFSDIIVTPLHAVKHLFAFGYRIIEATKTIDPMTEENTKKYIELSQKTWRAIELLKKEVPVAQQFEAAAALHATATQEMGAVTQSSFDVLLGHGYSATSFTKTAIKQQDTRRIPRDKSIFPSPIYSALEMIENAIYYTTGGGSAPIEPSPPTQ